jgi:drug/metabolite transporter (DMT)-like permease
MTASVTTALVGERLGTFGWGGIVLLAAGVLLLSLRGGRDLAKLDSKAVGFALFTAVSICIYSVVDGIGVRAAGPGKASAYTLILFVGIAPVVVGYAMARRGMAVLPAMAPYWKIGLGGGALAVISYSIVLWAMTVAPIAIIAALRETSVLFGALIAVVFLGEPLRAARIAAALMIVAGLMLLRLA